MKIDLRAHIELTSQADRLGLEIEGVVKLANEAFVKGLAPNELGEGAQITDWTASGSRIGLRIRSGKSVRAHDALLRFKNMIAENLGEKHKVGVRNIMVETCRVSIPGSRTSLQEAEKLLKGIATAELMNGELAFSFSSLSEKDLKDRVIDRAIRLFRPAVEQVVQAENLATFGTVLRKGEHKDSPFADDVAETAEKLRWAKRFPGRGQWVFTAPMAALLQAINEILVKKVCEPLGFSPWMFPRLLPIEVFKKLSTYMEHLPEGLFYVCVPPRQPEAFDEFKREYALRREVRGDLLKKILGDPEYVLDAIQCPPFYQYFSGETVRLEDLPIKAYDNLGGWTWRNEAGGIEGITRTNEFWRMEMVFLASPEEAVDVRDRTIDLVIDLAEGELDLEWRAVAGAPFYLSAEEAKKRTIDISETEKIPTVDVECYLPYKGDRDTSEWLEVTAATVHKNFYVDAFKIKEAKEREIWTGCVGQGLTRWAAAILARHSFDFDAWPKTIRSTIGKLPTPPKTVT